MRPAWLYTIDQPGRISRITLVARPANWVIKRRFGRISAGVSFAVPQWRLELPLPPRTPLVACESSISTQEIGFMRGGKGFGDAGAVGRQCVPRVHCPAITGHSQHEQNGAAYVASTRTYFQKVLTMLGRMSVAFQSEARNEPFRHLDEPR